MTAAYPPGQRHPDDRVDLGCDSCRRYDRHPRHVFLNGDGSVTYKHMDCCHRDGCPENDPEKNCGEILRRSGSAHGEDLIAFLHSRMPEEQ